MVFDTGSTAVTSVSNRNSMLCVAKYSAGRKYILSSVSAMFYRDS
jgi:hypothetical protein